MTMASSLVSIYEARNLSLKYYFTGRECSHGHVMQRRTANKVCLGCERLREQGKREEKIRAGHKIRSYSKRKPGEPKKRSRDNPAVKKRWKTKNIAIYRNSDRVSKHKRRNRLRGSFSSRDIKILAERQKFKCINCNTSIRDRHHIDHIMPIALGGMNVIGNIQLLCPFCNISKHAKHPIVWAQENGRLL